MPAPEPSVTGGNVATGCFLGVLLTWLSTFVITVGGWSAGATESALGTAVALFLVPAVSVALMIPRRTRYAGAGLMLGFAVGSVTAAGVCRLLVSTI